MTLDALAVETDAVIIGAGPAGLFQVFELGLLGFHAHVIDALPQAGGQTTELYPDKPIYDIPAVPVCSGRELTAQLLTQIAPFTPTLHFGQLVRALEGQPDGRWRVETDAGLALVARTVFIAAGTGAFVPRRLKVAGLDALEGAHVFHHAPTSPHALAGRRVVVVGGDERALARAAALAEQIEAGQAGAPASVTLLHRRAVYQAEPATLARVQALAHTGRLALAVGQIERAEIAGGRLLAVHVIGPDGQSAPLPLDALLVLQGLAPRLGPIADWGLALEKKQLAVDPRTMQTSAPGVFAVGDVAHYPGKRKLILCGFHEAALAAYAAEEHIRGAAGVQPFQYTTSSTRLHRLLGVAAPSADE